MRISDCSSDVCSSDLAVERFTNIAKASLGRGQRLETIADARPEIRSALDRAGRFLGLAALVSVVLAAVAVAMAARRHGERHLSGAAVRSEEHTSELPSLMRISYAVFCLKKKTT